MREADFPNAVPNGAPGVPSAGDPPPGGPARQTPLPQRPARCLPTSNRQLRLGIPKANVLARSWYGCRGSLPNVFMWLSCWKRPSHPHDVLECLEIWLLARQPGSWPPQRHPWRLLSLQLLGQLLEGHWPQGHIVQLALRHQDVQRWGKTAPADAQDLQGPVRPAGTLRTTEGVSAGLSR